MLVFNFLLAWYIRNIFPGEFGIPKPYYFCFMPSYWCGHKNKVIPDEEVKLLESTQDESNFEAPRKGSRNF